MFHLFSFFFRFLKQLRYLWKLSTLFKFNRLAGSTEIDGQKRNDVYNKADWNKQNVNLETNNNGLSSGQIGLQSRCSVIFKSIARGRKRYNKKKAACERQTKGAHWYGKSLSKKIIAYNSEESTLKKNQTSIWIAAKEITKSSWGTLRIIERFPNHKKNRRIFQYFFCLSYKK